MRRGRLNRQQYKSKNFRGVLSLFTGNSISRIVAAIGTLILANYYGPENYGMFNVFLSYALILPVVMGLRLDTVMIMTRGGREIWNLFSGLLVLSLGWVAFFVLVFFLIKQSGFIELSFSSSFFILIVLGGLLSTWNIAQQSVFVKFKLFHRVSASVVIAAVTAFLMQTLFLFSGEKENGLVYGWMVGLFFSFLYNFRIIAPRLKKLNWSIFRLSIRNNRKILMFSYPSDSINAIANNILPILMLFYFSKAEIGIFSMAFKILTVPLFLLSEAVSKVYFQRAVILYRQDKRALNRLTKKIVVFVVTLMLIFVLLLNTIGKSLLINFLGVSWIGMPSYIAALSFWILARSALNPISYIIVVLNKNHLSLIFNIYLLLVNVISIFLGRYLGNLLQGIWCFSVLSGIGYCVLLCIVFTSLKKEHG